MKNHYIMTIDIASDYPAEKLFHKLCLQSNGPHLDVIGLIDSTKVNISDSNSQKQKAEQVRKAVQRHKKELSL